MTLYLATASSPAIRARMVAGDLGMLTTPAEGRTPADGVVWAADNGCFTAGDRFDADGWFLWLTKLAPHAGRCVFAAAPDVVGDAAATIERAAPWLPRIRALGYPAALVAQDGLEDLEVPWDDFDALFIGGSTEWKLGSAARTLTAEAKARGKFVHMGRVNSDRRYRYAAAIGCDSVDGTFLAFGPDINLGRLLGWVKRHKESPPLFDLV